jgi:N-acetylmuramic acid 6-phosphate etherase
MNFPETEAPNPGIRDLDTMDTAALVSVLVKEQLMAQLAVERAMPTIARAVDIIAGQLQRGGSLHYVGAGTSGRLAMLDAAECPPTFGTPPSMVVAHIAGGTEALVRAVEGAEDDAAAGEREMREVGHRDAVVGVSASGEAPFVVAALNTAHANCAATIAITSVAGSSLARAAGLPITIGTGSEALAGSTRLKGGTAQKLVLNAISTAVMVKLGRVYDNLMVDVVATNAKLRRRALRLVGELTERDPAGAAALLEAAEGSVKVAVVMARRNVDAGEARALLERAGGFLRRAL